MDTGAGKADEGAKLGGGPLWRRGIAVHTSGVAGELLEGEELGYSLDDYLKRTRRICISS